MSTEERASEQAVRAYEYAIAQIWDVARGIKDAYQVDTAEDLEWHIPEWSELTHQQKREWSLAVGPVVGNFPLVATRIAGSGV